VVPELYRVSIFDGPARRRTIEVTASEANYGLSEQVADFGGEPEGFVFSVAQVSAALGEGHAAEAIYGE
jgi:hypothetical protein